MLLNTLWTEFCKPEIKMEKAKKNQSKKNVVNEQRFIKKESKYFNDIGARDIIYNFETLSYDECHSLNISKLFTNISFVKVKFKPINKINKIDKEFKLNFYFNMNPQNRKTHEFSCPINSYHSSRCIVLDQKAKRFNFHLYQILEIIGTPHNILYTKNIYEGIKWLSKNGNNKGLKAGCRGISPKETFEIFCFLADNFGYEVEDREKMLKSFSRKKKS